MSQSHDPISYKEETAVITWPHGGAPALSQRAGFPGAKIGSRDVFAGVSKLPMNKQAAAKAYNLSQGDC